MRALFVITLIHILPMLVFGQKAETLQRITADRFPKADRLIVQFDPSDEKKRFSYESDGSNIFQSMPKFFSTRQQNKRTISVVSKFINPLNYRLEASFKVSDDPRNAVISEFAATLRTVTVIAFPSPAATAATSTVLIPDWMFNLSQQNGVTNAYKINVLKAVAELENVLIGEFKIGEDLTLPNKTFEQHIQSEMVQLKAKENPIAFRDELEKAAELQTRLKGVTDQITIKLEKLKTVMSNPVGFATTTAFKELTESAKKNLDDRVKKELKGKVAMNGDFKAIIDELDKVKIDGENIVLTVNGIELEAKKEYAITLKATEKSLNEETLKITDKKTFESQFTIIIGRFNVEVSGGIAYLFKPVTFNSYNTYQDSTSFRIGNSPANKVVLPTVYLNVYQKIRDNLILILPQVGVGTGKDYPTIFLGTGLVVPNQVIISVGAACVLNQNLKDGYEVNQKIKGDDVTNFKNKAYSVTPEFRPYVSAQIKF